MNVNVSTGSASAYWNDQGSTCSIMINGASFMAEEQALRDLYECLDFLFGRPS